MQVRKRWAVLVGMLMLMSMVLSACFSEYVRVGQEEAAEDLVDDLIQAGTEIFKPTDPPTLEPTKPPPTEVPKTGFLIPDPANDGVLCSDGTPSDEQLPAGIDYREVAGEVSPEGNHVLFTMRFEDPESPEPFFAWIEFNDPLLPLDADDPNWFFANRGNTNFFLQILGDDVRAELHRFTEDGWAAAENSVQAERVDAHIEVRVDVNVIPQGAALYFGASDGMNCDEVGLLDGVPAIGEILVN
jgi:hypothetical protein